MSDRTQQIHRFARAIPNPAAGAELAVRPDGGRAWRILNMIFTFTASAVVANRNIQLNLSDGNTRTWRGTTAVVQAAASVQEYEAYPNAISGVSVSGLALLALPIDGLWMPPGYVLTTTTALIDVGDQYSGIALDLVELETGPEYYGEPSIEYNRVPLNQ